MGHVMEGRDGPGPVADVASDLEALLANLGLKKWEIKEARHPSFLQGRVAAVYVKGRKIGVVGEIHPEVLNNFELENPTSAFETNLQKILKTKS